MTHTNQILLTAGPIESMSCTRSGAIVEKYKTDTQEDDSRVWRHCQQSDLRKQYIFSPDTDTYIIGLSNHKQGAQTFIDLTPVGADNTKFLSLNQLLDCLQCDPDLAYIQQHTLPSISFMYA